MTYKILAQVLSLYSNGDPFFYFVWFHQFRLDLEHTAGTNVSEVCSVQSERPSVSNNWIRNASVSGFVRN